MNISSDNLDYISKEIDFVLQKMDEAATPEEKLYYFSALHGIINRVMNFKCDPILVFAHQVLSTVHTIFISRFASIKSGGEKHLAIPPEILEKLQGTLSEFKTALQQKELPKIYSALQQFANIGYATTGNGFYLYQKGLLKI